MHVAVLFFYLKKVSKVANQGVAYCYVYLCNLIGKKFYTQRMIDTSLAVGNRERENKKQIHPQTHKSNETKNGKNYLFNAIEDTLMQLLINYLIAV